MTEALGQTEAAMVTGAGAAETAMREETLQVPLATFMVASLVMGKHIACTSVCFECKSTR